MRFISENRTARNYQNLDRLNAVADYIFYEFEKYADTTYFQEFKVNGVTYKNVIAKFNLSNPVRTVIGAHYDVCGNQPGADDNASGVIGLLEIARQLKGQTIHKQIELVAFTLEEPPFFKTEYMGSYIHAKSLIDEKAQVNGMISLEMIGYFDSTKGSQSYPLGFLKLFYGNKGDFITVVNKMKRGKFARKFTKKMKHSKTIEVKNFQGFKAIPGVDFSDHLNYWKFGFSAAMVTDTAFFRNHNYHQKGDTVYTIDFTRMAQVIDSVLYTICC
jgi:Zn-dependent M28 family amino/carboxypeptidase